MQRVLSDPGFDGDDGSAEIGLTGALQAWTATGDPSVVHEALLSARVMVPIVAILDEVDPNGAE